jgi:ketosteroid isomerase-like protein
MSLRYVADRLLRFAPLTLLSALCVASDGAGAPATDEEVIWKMELAIFAGRANGDLSFYVQNAHPDYTGWPPQLPAPIGFQALAESANRTAGRGGEQVNLTKNQIRIADQGRLALAFFTTHRTRRSGGAAVDESFENIHVWIKDGTQWRIVGGMSRPVPPRRSELSGPLKPQPR